MVRHVSSTFYHRWLGWHAPALRRALVVLAILFAGTAVLLQFLPWELASILGWDVAGATFLASVWHLILSADSTQVAKLALREDATRANATALIVSVCVASLLSVGYALSSAGRHTGAQRALLVSVSILTVAISWTVLHTVYTLRYAHLYYASAKHGVSFGESGAALLPTYRDFAYLAFTIGMTYQVSDTTLSDARIRRSVLAQALLSYVFGVVIVAGAVNLIADLIR